MTCGVITRAQAIQALAGTRSTARPESTSSTEAPCATSAMEAPAVRTPRQPVKYGSGFPDQRQCQCQCQCEERTR